MASNQTTQQNPPSHITQKVEALAQSLKKQRGSSIGQEQLNRDLETEHHSSADIKRPLRKVSSIMRAAVDLPITADQTNGQSGPTQGDKSVTTSKAMHFEKRKRSIKIDLDRRRDLAVDITKEMKQQCPGQLEPQTDVLLWSQSGLNTLVPAQKKVQKKPSEIRNNRLQEIYGSDVREQTAKLTPALGNYQTNAKTSSLPATLRNQYQSPARGVQSRQPSMAASFRQRQAILNEKLNGLAAKAEKTHEMGTWQSRFASEMRCSQQDSGAIPIVARTRLLASDLSLRQSIEVPDVPVDVALIRQEASQSRTFQELKHGGSRVKDRVSRTEAPSRTYEDQNITVLPPAANGCSNFHLNERNAPSQLTATSNSLRPPIQLLLLETPGKCKKRDKKVHQRSSSPFTAKKKEKSVFASFLPKYVAQNFDFAEGRQPRAHDRTQPLGTGLLPLDIHSTGGILQNEEESEEGEDEGVQSPHFAGAAASNQVSKTHLLRTERDGPSSPIISSREASSRGVLVASQRSREELQPSSVQQPLSKTFQERQAPSNQRFKSPYEERLPLLKVRSTKVAEESKTTSSIGRDKKQSPQPSLQALQQARTSNYRTREGAAAGKQASRKQATWINSYRSQQQPRNNMDFDNRDGPEGVDEHRRKTVKQLPSQKNESSTTIMSDNAGLADQQKEIQIEKGRGCALAATSLISHKNQQADSSVSKGEKVTHQMKASSTQHQKRAGSLGEAIVGVGMRTGHRIEAPNAIGLRSEHQGTANATQNGQRKGMKDMTKHNLDQARKSLQDACSLINRANEHQHQIAAGNEMARAKPSYTDHRLQRNQSSMQAPLKTQKAPQSTDTYNLLSTADALYFNKGGVSQVGSKTSGRTTTTATKLPAAILPPETTATETNLIQLKQTESAHNTSHHHKPLVKSQTKTASGNPSILAVSNGDLILTGVPGRLEQASMSPLKSNQNIVERKEQATHASVVPLQASKGQLNFNPERTLNSQSTSGTTGQMTSTAYERRSGASQSRATSQSNPSQHLIGLAAGNDIASDAQSTTANGKPQNKKQSLVAKGTGTQVLMNTTTTQQTHSRMVQQSGSKTRHVIHSNHTSTETSQPHTHSQQRKQTSHLLTMRPGGHEQRNQGYLMISAPVGGGAGNSSTGNGAQTAQSNMMEIYNEGAPTKHKNMSHEGQADSGLMSRAALLGKQQTGQQHLSKQSQSQNKQQVANGSHQPSKGNLVSILHSQSNVQQHRVGCGLENQAKPHGIARPFIFDGNCVPISKKQQSSSPLQSIASQKKTLSEVRPPVTHKATVGGVYSDIGPVSQAKILNQSAQLQQVQGLNLRNAAAPHSENKSLTATLSPLPMGAISRGGVAESGPQYGGSGTVQGGNSNKSASSFAAAAASVVGHKNAGNFTQVAIGSQDSPLAKALSFQQQMGEYYATKTTSAILGPPQSHQHMSGSSRCQNDLSSKLQQNYAKLKRVADLVAGVGLQNHQGEEQLAHSPKMRLKSSAMPNSNTASKVLSNTTSSQANNNHVRHSLELSNGLNLGAANITVLPTLIVGKAATYSPRKGKKPVPSFIQHHNPSSVRNAQQLQQSDPSRKEEDLVQSINVAASQTSQNKKSAAVQEYSNGLKTQGEGIEGPTTQSAARLKSKLSSSQSLNERASSVQLGSLQLPGKDSLMPGHDSNTQLQKVSQDKIESAADKVKRQTGRINTDSSASSQREASQGREQQTKTGVSIKDDESRIPVKHMATSGTNPGRSRRAGHKRKHTTRSIISSKPSLHSSVTKTPVLLQNQPQSKNLAHPVVAPSGTSSAVPANHELRSTAGPQVSQNKFMVDQRRLESYYHAKGGICDQGSGSQRPDSQYSANRGQKMMVSHQQSQPNCYSGNVTNSSGAAGTGGGSRSGKRSHIHRRKNSRALQGCASSNLGSTKSHPQGIDATVIQTGCNTRQRRRHITKGGEAKASQRSGSAVSSPLQPHLATAGKHDDLRQSAIFTRQESNSEVTVRSRPQTVAKAQSSVSIAPAQLSRQHTATRDEEKRKVGVEPYMSKGSILQGINNLGDKQASLSVLSQVVASNTIPTRFGDGPVTEPDMVAKTFDSQTSVKGSASGAHQMASVELKQPLNSSHRQASSRKTDRQSSSTNIGKNSSQQQLPTSKKEPPTLVSKLTTSQHSDSKKALPCSSAKKTSSYNSKSNTGAPATIKPSQVKRVRQIQNSQKTLELRTRDKNGIGFSNIASGQGKLKEPQSATKVISQKNKLLTAFSMMSRCESEASKSITAAPSQSQISSASIAPFLSSNKDTLMGETAHQISLQLREKPTNTIDEVIEEQAKDSPDIQTIKRQAATSIPTASTAAESKGAAASTVALAQTQQISASPEPQQRLVSFAEAKQQASMKTVSASSHHAQQLRSFQNDDDYVPTSKNHPYCSCKSYVVIDSHHSKVLQSKNKDEVREMASLTKMMTAIVCLELAEEMKMDIRATYFKVSQRASSTIGTTANLLDTQVLTIWDLLHGLMLPSGNDAAMVLAENFTERIIRANNRNFKLDESVPMKIPDSGIAVFVKQMNKTARKVHMRHTNYANPHGLADKSNHSTALELAYLANYCMKNELFRQIVNTKTFTSINYLPVKRSKRLPNYEYETWTFYHDSEVPFPHGEIQYVQFHQTWYNSNKLLDLPGFCGVKTGVTSTAGCCLSIYFKSALTSKNLVTVVLGSKNIEYRWKDTRRLTLWTEAILAEEQQQRTGSPVKKEVKKTVGPRFQT